MPVPEPLRKALQDKLQRRASALNSGDLIYGGQRNMRAGSPQRDQSARDFGDSLDEAGRLTDELRKEGIIDGWGQLTDDARSMGLTRPWRVGDPY